QPLRSLTRPREALALQTDRAELRTLTDRNAMVGVQKFTPGSLYPDRLAGVREDYPEGPANVLVVDPTLKEERPRHFRSLKAALEDAPAGDLTVLIRYSGPLEVRPVVLDRPDLNLTIKPEGNA